MSSECVQLVSVNNMPMVSSREVAKKFRKDHFHVLRDIRNLIKNLPEKFVSSNFGFNNINVLRGSKQELESVVLSKDAFTLLAMGFTGRKALEWKIKFIEAFNDLTEQAVASKEMIEELQKKVLALEANWHHEKTKRLKPSKKGYVKAPVYWVNVFGQLEVKWQMIKIEDADELTVLKAKQRQQYVTMSGLAKTIQKTQEQIDKAELKAKNLYLIGSVKA